MIKINKNNKWGLNTNLNELTLNERKDALVLLFFLNKYVDDTRAFQELKSDWVDNIYRLPATSDFEYNSVKNGRYNILSRMKRIYKDYMVQLQPQE